VFILGQRVYRTIVFQLNFNCRFLVPKTIMFLLALHAGRVIWSWHYVAPGSIVVILRRTICGRRVVNLDTQ